MGVLIIVIAFATVAGLPSSGQIRPVAQPPTLAAAGASSQAQNVSDDRDAADLGVVEAEPDFTLVALPTTLRLPDGKWAFRVTHRFTRALGEGDFSDLAGDLFGLDGGALVGLEVRYGVRSGTQVSFVRTSDRTIQVHAQQSLLLQRDGAPVGLDAVVGLQGRDNFSEDYSPAIGLLLSRQFGDRGAVYAEPIFVLNALPAAEDNEHVLVIGLGTRIRFGASTYVVVEIAPRLGDAPPGDPHASIAIEKRRGGHSFQINVSNSFASTFGQLAQGFGSTDDWHLGFSISRKFWRGR